MSITLEGVYNIAPTPFNPDGSLDLPSISTLVDFVASKGVNGMTILGVMGETDKVSAEERAQVIGAFMNAAAGKLPICVGTTHASTGQCIRYSQQAEAMGAVAVMVAPPAMKGFNRATLLRHYTAVAEAITIPIVVQDHPPSSGIVMPVDFIAALATTVTQCRTIKMEDVPAPPKVSAILAAAPTARVFGGTGGMMFLEELRRGAIGTMTGFAFPDVLAEVYRRFESGDEAAAADLFYRYTPLIRYENQPGISLALRKYIYQMRGAIAHATPREPYGRIDEAAKRDVADMLAWAERA